MLTLSPISAPYVLLLFSQSLTSFKFLSLPLHYLLRNCPLLILLLMIHGVMEDGRLRWLSLRDAVAADEAAFTVGC